MERPRRRCRSRGCSRRKSRRTDFAMIPARPIPFLAALALGANLVAAWPHLACAQSAAPPASTVRSKPAAKPGYLAQGAAPVASAARTPAAPDLAFGAFQRGYFLTAFALAEKRIEQDSDPKSMTLLGELYANGLGVPKDDAKAAEWYKLAAARGDSNAMFALAMFALNGRAGPRDRQASAKWLASAAKLGHPQAAYDLALLYIEGQLFPQDFKRAAELLRIAADAGSPDAQYALGTFYKEGRGVPKDMHEAVKLWAQAALADNTDAEVEYAIALYNGDGVPKNEAAAALIFHKAALHISPINATKWHLISRANGETNLQLDDFVDKLDPATRAAGEKAAKIWLDAQKAAQDLQNGALR